MVNCYGFLRREPVCPTTGLHAWGFCVPLWGGGEKKSVEDEKKKRCFFEEALMDPQSAFVELGVASLPVY